MNGVYKIDGKLVVQIINDSNYPLPEYKTEGSAGMDLYDDIIEDVILNSLDRVLIPTGIKIGLPKGYEAQVRPRSGLSIKYGIGMVNAPGTIDSDYRGIIGVNLVNLSKNPYIIHPGDRIAQLVVAKHEIVKWAEVTDLEDTERGDGGFGSTGK